MQLRGRHWVILWLAAFLVVAVIVETRQLKAYALSRQTGLLRKRRQELDATRQELIRKIGEGSSRRVLLPKAEALGLHVPTDAEEDFISPAPAGAR